MTKEQFIEVIKTGFGDRLDLVYSRNFENYIIKNYVYRDSTQLCAYDGNFPVINVYFSLKQEDSYVCFDVCTGSVHEFNHYAAIKKMQELKLVP